MTVEENRPTESANEPTIEQLTNFAAVVIMNTGMPNPSKTLIKHLLETDETLRQAWLEIHQKVQRDLDEYRKQ